MAGGELPGWVKSRDCFLSVFHSTASTDNFRGPGLLLEWERRNGNTNTVLCDGLWTSRKTKNDAEPRTANGLDGHGGGKMVTVMVMVMTMMIMVRTMMNDAVLYVSCDEVRMTN